jgi:hypothetical protein
VGVLGHFLERAGFATTQISLIRLHTETIRPPRALWVPFELGRPFGVPDNADFQRRVLSAALNLLGADDGPVLVDFPEEAPSTAAEDMDGWVCPILRRPGAMEEKDPTELLLAEIDSLQQWYDLFVERNDRTSVGASGLAIADIARYLADLHAKPDSATPPGEFTAAEAVKVGSEDLKAFYFEASLGMPGHKNSSDITNWFWGDTIAGQTLLALMPICMASDDADLRAVGKLTLVPRAQQYRV